MSRPRKSIRLLGRPLCVSLVAFLLFASCGSEETRQGAGDAVGDRGIQNALDGEGASSESVDSTDGLVEDWLERGAPDTQVSKDEDSSLDVAPSGLPVTGCNGSTVYLPTGYTAMRVEPEDFELRVNVADPKGVKFYVFGTLEDGSEVPVQDVSFALTNSKLGFVANDGSFTPTPERGGETLVQATIEGACVETSLKVVAHLMHIVGQNATVPLQFEEALSAGKYEKGVDLRYPLDKALWPSNFPPLPVQWSREVAVGTPDLFQIVFSAPFARVDIYGSTQDWFVKSEEWVAKIPEEAWAKLWKLDSGGSYTIKVFSMDSGAAGGAAVGVSDERIFHMSQEPIGGAFYYWNTKVEGIQILEFEETTNSADLTPSPLPIGDGCYGCHTTSPDGEVVAVTVAHAGMIPAPEEETEVPGFWYMQLVNALDGSKSTWIHEDAEDFLEGEMTVNASFSDAYWSAETTGEGALRHMIVSQGGMPANPPAANPEGRHIHSVNLLTGETKQLTDSSGATEDDTWSALFPSFSSDGEFVVFVKGLGLAGKGGASQGASLWRLPYNGGQGGAITPIPGANLEDELQYYPSLTPDDEYVVYNRVSDPSGSGNTHCFPSQSTNSNCGAEIWMIPSAGGDPRRLDRASGPVGAGFANSWPSVGPNANQSHYWVAFSSLRPYGVKQVGADGFAPRPQIWLAAIDKDAPLSGADPSFAPIWLPGQDIEGGNHLAQWSVARDIE